MNNLLYKEYTYKIIGICMEVHNQLGKGFSEVVYSDALEIEFIDNNIKYSKEKKFNISYKGNILPHKYRADFIINDSIVLEIKAIRCLTDSHVKQTLNYLAVSKLKIGLLINFGEDSLKYKRVIL
ncbi:GxxExxY protein [Polaribacter vadi]|uniref:GxxExxY protein n=1 Tax=Polaribacter vadi TaxID=1774273 RepID=UPI0030EE6FE1|tara:strand:+ start:5255 stop:5629 length:375 start_codon:yes stop_codon:yes gene_type:complete